MDRCFMNNVSILKSFGASILAGFLTLALVGNSHAQTVVAWGNYSYGQTNVPASATNVIAVSAGENQSMALRSDGTVVAWGYVSTVPPNVINVTAIAAGYNFCSALTADGTVLKWGKDATSATILGTNMIAIASGECNYGMDSNGTVSVWGTPSLNLFPSGNNTNYSMIAAGNNWSAGMTKDGLIKYRCYGTSVQNGQLVKALANEIVEFAGSSSGDCVVTKRNGKVASNYIPLSSSLPDLSRLTNIVSTVLCDGSAVFLQNNSQLTSVCKWFYSPNTPIPASATNVIGISSSSSHILALRGNGAPVILSPVAFQTNCLTGSALPLSARFVASQPGFQWLADGTPIPGATNATPSIPAVCGNDNVAYQVVISNSYGIVTSAVAKVSVIPVAAWGYNKQNQCFVPDSVTNAVAIAARGFQGIAIDDNGVVTAWGEKKSSTSTGRPYIVPECATNITAIGTGIDFHMGVRTDGQVVAWGFSPQGETNVPASATNAIAVAGGAGFGMALRGDGSVVSWGTNDYGQLSLPPSANGVVAIAAGYHHSLALRSDGVVVGSADTMVPDSATNIIGIAAGWEHSIAVRRDGTLLAWGDNTFGQSTIPAEATNIVSVKAGWYHNLALRADGSAIAWGKNIFGIATIPAGLANLNSIAVGEDFNLGLVAYGPARVSRQVNTVQTHGGGVAILSASVRGALPLTLQWYHNAAPVPDATNQTLILTNVTADMAGDYVLAAQNTLGGAIAGNATTLIVDSTPALGSSAFSKSVVPGKPVVLAPTVYSSGPSSYQWLRDGTVLADTADMTGATTPVLNFSKTAESDSGNYSLAIVNASGTTTNLAVRLAVSPIVVWGDNLYGQLDIPVNATNIVAISSGANHLLALKADGSVIGWGDNSMLLNNIPTEATNAIAISDLGNPRIAIREDGTVVTWTAQLHYSSLVYKQYSYITALDSPIAAESGSLVLSANGLMRALPSGLKPTLIASNIVSIAGAYTSSSVALGLQTNGQIKVIAQYQSNPQYQAWNPILSSITDAVAIKGNGLRLVVLRRSGTLLSLNSKGQESVPTEATDVAAILAVGNNQIIVQRANGSVLAWGDVGPTGQDQFPDSVVHPVQMTSGESQTAALLYAATKQRQNPIGVSLTAGQDGVLIAGGTSGTSSTYQWRLNGIDIPGATNALLNFTDLRWTNSGTFSVVINNLFGVTTNTMAMNVPRTQLSFDTAALRQQPRALIVTNASGVGSIITLASTNLIDWTPIATNQSLLTPMQIDTHPDGNAIFYRAVEEP
jgi:alpha-tubulin suppressor-like RCC1 family protein